MPILKKKWNGIVEEYIGQPDNVTDKYIFTNKRNFIPNAVRSVIGMKQVRPDRRKKRYGRIHAHLFYYITLPMVLITSGVVYVVASNLSVLFVYFNTNIYLNGLIVSLMIFGILRIYYNCFLFFRTASFLRKMERTSQKEKITELDIIKLRNALETKGSLVNISTMDDLINHIEEFHFLKITDNQARFIKSKLGFRAASNRKNVNFISGILVMLGLLGTFLGLLATIDSVGDALNSMANIGGDGGEIGMEEMTSFIGSLAAPLQGMGLAFSSSLFGLSGSLLIGFFLHLANTPQNEFIENVSRWIDDRIYDFDPRKLADKADPKNHEAKVMQPAKDADIKDWLSGYIYLSTKTHKQLSVLSERLDNMNNELNAVSGNLNSLIHKEEDLKNSILSLGSNFKEMSEHALGITVSLKDIQNLSHTMNSALTGIDLSNNKIANSIEGLETSSRNVEVVAQSIGSAMTANQEQVSNINNNISAVNDTLGKSNDNNGRYASAMYKEMKKLLEFQEQNAQLLSESVPSSFTAIKAYIQAVEDMNENTQSFSEQAHNENMRKLQNIEQHLSSLDQTGKDVVKLSKSKSAGASVSGITEPSAKRSFSLWKKR